MLVWLFRIDRNPANVNFKIVQYIQHEMVNQMRQA